MQKTPVALLGLFILMVLTSFVGFALVSPAAASGSNRANIAAVPSPTAATPEEGIGIPAIHPQSNTVDPSTPAFTAADVEQYINNTPMPRNLAANIKPVIVKIEFETSREVSALLSGESIGVPDDTLLCYVELQGTFIFTRPDGSTITSQKGFEVFDAHTGNLLVAGTLG